jgi:hypothetical protein
MDNLLDLVHEMYTTTGVSVIYHYISEDDIKTIMRSPYVMIGSDGDIRVFGSGAPHPRSYGTFPRVLGHYVNELYVISPEEAIRKMTSLPAAKMGLKDRGLLREGNWADIVIYDELSIMDKADFFNPHQYPEGIDYVIVNGIVAADHGVQVAADAGMVLRGPGYIPSGPAFDYAKPSASVKVLSGSKNDLTVTVTEYYIGGEPVVISKTFRIDNNSGGNFDVGRYKVFVATAGNDQIREVRFAD